MIPFSIVLISLFSATCNSIKVPTRELSSGYRMPVFGLGTFNLHAETADIAITAALKNGYRLIDTAFFYENEKDIGNSLRKWFAREGKREDIFITTKLSPQALRPSDIETALNLSLENLGLEYIDMYLIHTPFGTKRTPDFRPIVLENGTFVIDDSTDLVAVWKEMEKQVKAGKIRSIGLSNFNKTQIMEIWNNAEIKPSNLQVETNVYIQQNELLELCNELGIVMTGYSPLGSPYVDRLRRKRENVELPPLLENPVLNKIAQKYEKSPAQISLRFGLQRNVIVIPKSSSQGHVEENIDIFDFELTEEDMHELRMLDQHGKYRKVDFRTFSGVDNHPEYPFA